VTVEGEKKRRTKGKREEGDCYIYRQIKGKGCYTTNKKKNSTNNED